MLATNYARVVVRLPGKGDTDSHGARPVHQIMVIIKWIRTSRLSIKNSLYDGRVGTNDRLSLSRLPAAAAFVVLAANYY